MERFVHHVLHTTLALVVRRRESGGQNGQEEGKGESREADAVHLELLDEKSDLDKRVERLVTNSQNV